MKYLPAALAMATLAPAARFDVGQPFPAMELPSLKDGSRASVANFRGEKLILHIFASW